MNIQEIIKELTAERDRIDDAIRLLTGIGSTTIAKRRGRPPGPVKKMVTPTPAKKKRTMSADGRKRIADAMRKRWAAKRKMAA
jgi:hypothetical protein